MFCFVGWFIGFIYFVVLLRQGLGPRVALADLELTRQGQLGLEFTVLPAVASPVLGLKANTVTPSQQSHVFNMDRSVTMILGKLWNSY